MRIERFPCGYDLRSRFLASREIGAYEDSGVDTAEKDRKSRHVVDEYTMADVLDPQEAFERKERCQVYIIRQDAVLGLRDEANRAWSPCTLV